MADVEILAQQVEAAPLIYDIPGGQEILVKCLSATFNGASAGSAWVPAIQIIGPSGLTLRTFPLSTSVAAGASADVSWFPRGGVSTGGGGGSGIQFDTEPQSGTFLDWETTGVDGGGRFGQTLTNANGMTMQGASVNEPTLFITQSAAFANAGWETLHVETDDGGFIASGPTAIEGDVSLDSHNSAGQGVIGSVGASSGWTQGTATPSGDFGLIGTLGTVVADAGSTGRVAGVFGFGENDGTGPEVGVAGQTAGSQTGANSIALGALNAAGAWIFQVRNDGSVHIKTGTSVIADL